jgi:hypothetical protein
MNGLNAEPARSLRDVVVLVAVEIKTPDQGTHRAVHRVERDECRLGLGQLRDLPARCVETLHAQDCASTDAALWRRALEGSRCEAQALSRNADALAVLEYRLDLARAGGEHQRKPQFLVVGAFRERFLEIILVGLRGQLDEPFRAAITQPPVILEQPRPQCLDGCLLVGLADGGVDAETAAVGVFGVLLVHRLAHHLRDVIRLHGEGVHHPAH